MDKKEGLFKTKELGLRRTGSGQTQFLTQEPAGWTTLAYGVRASLSSQTQIVHFSVHLSHRYPIITNSPLISLSLSICKFSLLPLQTTTISPSTISFSLCFGLISQPNNNNNTLLKSFSNTSSVHPPRLAKPTTVIPSRFKWFITSVSCTSSYSFFLLSLADSEHFTCFQKWSNNNETPCLCSQWITKWRWIQ